MRQAQKEFYGSLFGWESDDNEIPGGRLHDVQSGRRGRGGDLPRDRAVPAPLEQLRHRRQCRRHSGDANVIEDSFDVMEGGRMALLQDPTGAAFCGWEPGEEIGATRVNNPGCLTWNELHSPDPDR